MYINVLRSTINYQKVHKMYNKVPKCSSNVPKSTINAPKCTQLVDNLFIFPEKYMTQKIQKIYR